MDISSVDPALVRYIEEQIIPIYGQFDKAHHVSHVRRTIENSMRMATHYPVNMNKVYAIAAYHDIGLQKGRSEHEKHSAVLFLADKNLAAFFTADDLQQMAEAIEDHRASSDQEPRSIYGKIVADADNDLEYFSILTRCMQHGVAHYPAYDKDAHFARIVAHMHDKYGINGYLKLWLHAACDIQGLQKIRDMLTNDLDGMRNDFDNLWETIGKG